MNQEEIHFGDWERLFFGHAPISFMIEVFLRTIFIYVILLLILRFLGKRMTSQTSILELSVMITLGAIIALPMQDPTTGLLPGIIILLCVLSFQRVSNWLSFKNSKIDAVVQGKATLLVKDGVLSLKEMRKAALSHEQLYSQLREKNIRHLGQVERVYLEASGAFSVFQFNEPKPGLSLIPAKDKKLSVNPAESDSYCACKNCGYVMEEEVEKRISCSNCGKSDWKPAIDEREESGMVESL